MKKFLLTFAALAFGFAAQAQLITFADSEVASSIGEYSKESDGVVMTYTSTDKKGAIDANSQYFVVSETEAIHFTTRLKAGGKSSSKLTLKITVPAAGDLYIFARSSSSSAASEATAEGVANGTFTFNDTNNEKYNIEGEESPKTTFAAFKLTATEAGDINITFPNQAINIYGISFGKPSGTIALSSIETAVSNISAEKSAKVFKTVENGQMIIVKNGVKYNVLGQIVK